MNKTEIFETMPVPKALMIMAVPAVLSQLIVLLYNIADTWFIGRTNNPYMVGAASLAVTLFLAISALSNLFGVGGGNLMVRLMGKKDLEEARKTASYSLFMATMVALAFSMVCLIFMNPLLRLLGASDNTLEYARQYLLFTVVIGAVPTVLSMAMPTLLRNAGYSKESGIGVALGGILNIALDPLFMFVILPDGYQVLGAALATMLSNIVSLIYYIAVYRKLRNITVLRFPGKPEKLRKESLKSIYSVGIPAAMILLLFDFVNIVINRLVVSYGDIALASMGIVLKLERIPLNIGLGVCLGMVPLVAYNYARKDFQRMDRFFLTAQLTIISVAAASTIVFYFFAEPIVGAFIRDPETIRLGTEIMKVRCLALPFMIQGFQIVNFMQAVNQGKYSFLLSVIRHLILNVPALLIFNALFGLTGLIWAQVVSDIANVIVSYAVYKYVHKKVTAQGDSRV